MGINHTAVWEKIQDLARTDRAVSKCMGEVVDLCSRDLPHEAWSQLAQLPYDEDVSALGSWIPTVFERHPAPFPIHGLYVGLYNPGFSDGQVWADMHVGALGQYHPRDSELGWLWGEKRHYPDESQAYSSSLRKIYEIAYQGERKLGNDAEWPLCLAFGVFAVRTLLSNQTIELLNSSADRVGVVVGFDSGDMLRIGELTQGGFVAESEGQSVFDARVEPIIVNRNDTQGERRIYKIKGHRADSKRWFLKTPLTPDGKEVNPGIFLRGKAVTFPPFLRLPVREKGARMDFTFADCGVPVVCKQIAEYLAEISPKGVQLFPVAVEGEAEPYFILNVLEVKDCMDMVHSVYDLWRECDSMPEKKGQIFLVAQLRVDPVRLEGVEICRIQNWMVPIIISERIKTFFASNHFTGMCLEEV